MVDKNGLTKITSISYTNLISFKTYLAVNDTLESALRLHEIVTGLSDFHRSGLPSVS